MTRDEYRHLLAQRSSLQRMLVGIPAGDVLDRGSVEARLLEVQQQLDAVPPDTRAPARARLTFRGRPVVGSHGIFAEFGLAATRAFTEAVTTMAASLARPLASSGPIPDRDQNQLLITSTAMGSFGFELEEYRDGPILFDDDCAVAKALEQTQELLEGTAGSDDELTDAAAGVDPRVISRIREFLEALATNDAVCALEFGEKVFRFQDVGQVRCGLARLAQDNLHEDQESFTGEFQGVLPKRRTFEFKIAGEDTVITGKIGPGISDPDTLNQHLHETTNIAVAATRVGNGRPRYVLYQPPAWGTSR